MMGKEQWRGWSLPRHQDEDQARQAACLRAADVGSEQNFLGCDKGYPDTKPGLFAPRALFTWPLRVGSARGFCGEFRAPG